jgi:hypothetical protein
VRCITVMNPRFCKNLRTAIVPNSPFHTFVCSDKEKENNIVILITNKDCKVVDMMMMI